MKITDVRMKILKRPSLRFIATLPTLVVSEITYKDTVFWKVQLDKPIDILYGNYPVLNTFWVEITTHNSFDENGEWHTNLQIGIKTTKTGTTYIIPPHDEDFYVKIKWWNWHKY